MKIWQQIYNSTLKAELIRHTGGTFLLKVLGLFLQLLTGMILARTLGASGYGIYAFPMAVVTLLTVPATAGLPQLLVRSISQYFANEKYGLMRGLLIRANQFVLLLSLVFFAGALGVFFLVGKGEVSTNESLTFVLAMGLLPLISLKNVRMAALRGLRKVIIGQVPETVVRPVLFLSLTAAFLLTAGKNMTPQLAMTFQLIATGVGFVVGSLLLIRYQPRGVKQVPSEYNSREWLKSAFPFMFLGMMQIVNKQTDIVMLGIMKSPADVGVYRAVVHGSMLVTFVLSAVNTAQSPQIARLWALGENIQLQKMVTATARVVALATLGTAFVLIIGGEFFLRVLFGEEFIVGLTALRILCIGQIVNGLAGSVGGILNMTGNENKAVLAMMISAISNVILNLILVPGYGLGGAAVATAVSLSIWNIMMVIWVKKYTKVKPTAFGNF